MPKSKRNWTIEVIGSNGDLLGRCHVPVHRLETDDVRNLLKVLIVKYEQLEFESIISLSLNSRKGGPLRYLIKEPVYHEDLANCRVGFYLFGPTIYASAYRSISAEAVEFAQKLKGAIAA